MTSESVRETEKESHPPLRVLLVEDNPDDAELGLRLLRKAYPEMHCDIVQTSPDFVRQVRTKYYDVILADYSLENWTGLDALKLARAQGRDTPFILVTGALGDQKAIECIQSGITDYVLKDRLDRLPIAISRALEERELRKEHERAERALKDSEAKFRMLADAIPAATFIEQGTQCCYVNRAAEHITGYPRKELLNMNFWELVVPDSRKLVIEREARRRHTDQSTSRYKIQIRTKLWDVRWLDVTTGMFQLNGGLAALITAFDITERQCEEDEMRDLAGVSRSSFIRQLSHM